MVEEGETGDQEVGDHHVAGLPVGLRVHRVEEDDAPGGVQEDHGQGHQAGDDEEARGLPMEAKGARA